MDVPQLRSDGVWAAAQYPLLGAGWACGGADLEPDGLAVNTPATMNIFGLRFEQILMTVEQDMRSVLQRARLASNHSLTIGEQAEGAVRAMLRSYLPSGFGVGRGHVYDAYGDGSLQTDIIITNPDHPLTYPDDQTGPHIVDGVAAVGEVKATLDVGTLDDCIAKGTAFKKLRMSVNESDHVVTHAQQAFLKRMGLCPPFLVWAFDNKVAIKTLLDRLGEAALVPPPEGKSLGPQDDVNEPQPPLDLICILGQGICLNVRPDNPMGVRLMTQSADGPPVDRSGWVFIQTSAPLALSLAWMNQLMPRILRGGSVFAPYLIPPMKMHKYMVQTGQLQSPRDADAATQQAENAVISESPVAQQIIDDLPVGLQPGADVRPDAHA